MKIHFSSTTEKHSSANTCSELEKKSPLTPLKPPSVSKKLENYCFLVNQHLTNKKTLEMFIMIHKGESLLLLLKNYQVFKRDYFTI